MVKRPPTDINRLVYKEPSQKEGRIMNTNNVMDRYNSLFPLDMTVEEVSKKLIAMNTDRDITDFRKIFCDTLVYMVTGGTMEYGKDAEFSSDSYISVLLHNIEKLPKSEYFFWMMHGLFSKNRKELFSNFDASVAQLDCSEQKLSEGELVNLYIEPLKDARDGFWIHAQEKLRDLCENNGTQELCSLLDGLYNRQSDDDGIELLSSFIQKYPEITIAKEFIALLYMNTKRWNIAAAYFEAVSENPMLFANMPGKLYFLTGISYGKANDLKLEEDAYRKCLDISPDYDFAKNNLAYCLYRQKKNQEALSLLDECLSQNRDLPYSANNMVRVLIALGRNKDAKALVRNKKYRISKNLIDKVNKLPDVNARLKKTEASPLIPDEEETGIGEEKEQISVKGSQFSTERILEDELTSRLEKGLPVFGKKLKIYKRKGQYGRQFIIPIGRLDLLCEDDSGNLYIIELKKDSGYDDVYAQISSYIDWMKNDIISKGKEVHGIICLNDPADDLIKKVHESEHIQLFEYKISYTEI